ncbi:site-2 protease family protein [Calycomorphotria hydatis]|uniref:Peptidase family M50 n=1 Tax=Calycomorphotria hydatis TaxID=2528027 RepID=A0A517TAB3_9PLAN|nr:site-2 protease family protein [Calycomorphotria hydatis]QDT65312.1 Peptidase family M50 [Calycomorphotria hydatis]
MLGPVRPTPYDLRFSIGDIPINVTPMFWIAAVLLGLPILQGAGPQGLIVWVLCVFISILLHELGHAFVQRAYGHRPEIILYHFGGVAQYMAYRQNNWWQQVLISFAGPGIQLLLYGAIWLLDEWLYRTGRYPEGGTPAAVAIQCMLYINLWWALLNLIPVIPLDGGQIMEAVLKRFRRFDGQELAYKVSIFFAVVGAVLMLMNGGRFIWILFALLAYQNYQNLRGGGRYGGW